MKSEYLKLLKALLNAEADEAHRICETILNTSLQLPHFSESLVSIFQMYYESVAKDYYYNRSSYNKARLEKVIDELKGLNL